MACSIANNAFLYIGVDNILNHYHIRIISSTVELTKWILIPLLIIDFKAGSKVWVRCLGVIEGHPEGFTELDGLWRPGAAFFQIGFTQKGSAHSCSNFGGKIPNGVPANS